MGIPLPDLPDASAENFGVWPENWAAVEMFLRVQTQWRTTMGGLLGLDYGVLAWVFKLYAVEDERSMLEDLQVMEAAAMAVLTERSA
jgi:ABC-type thiamine transport system substrate-binding protein